MVKAIYYYLDLSVQTVVGLSSPFLIVKLLCLQTGHFQLVEAIAMPPPMVFYQVNTNGAAITGFDMSPSCQSIMFGDNHGMLHEFTLGDNCCFNMYPEPTEFPDPVSTFIFILFFVDGIIFK